MKFGLTEETILKLLSVFNKYSEVSNVTLYGSRAKGTHREGSDIDISLVAPNLNLSDLLKMESEIDELLLPYKIDLSLMHKIENQSLLEHIQRVGVEFKL